MIQRSEAGLYYLDQCQRMHERGAKMWPGKPVLQHRERLRLLVDETNSKTALDYGCGKGLQFTIPLPANPVFNFAGGTFADFLGIPISGWDPAVPAFAERPGTGERFDLVMCANVLGLIPDEDMARVLDDIWSLARKAVFIQLRLTPPTKAKKRLPDGTHGPGAGRTREFWLDTLRARRGKRRVLIIEGVEH